MRFSLGVISAIVLANMAYAIPAAQSNMGIQANEFKAEQVSQLELKQDFEAFHWKSENDQKLVDRVFKFELSEPAELQITDFMMGGDVFEVLDNGKSIGKTSELELSSNAEPLYAATPEEALQDARFSKATYTLEAGAHEITIKVADSINENGTGALRVIQKLQSLWKHDKHDDDEDGEDDDEDDDKNEEYKDKGYEKKEENLTETVYKKKFKTETDTIFVYFTQTTTTTDTSETVTVPTTITSVSTTISTTTSPTTITVPTTVPTTTTTTDTSDTVTVSTTITSVSTTISTTTSPTTITVPTTVATTTTTTVTTTTTPLVDGCFVDNHLGFLKHQQGSALSYDNCIDMFGNCPPNNVAFGLQYRVIQGSSNYYSCFCYTQAQLPTVRSGQCIPFEKNADNKLYYHGINNQNVFVFSSPPPAAITTPAEIPILAADGSSPEM